MKRVAFFCFLMIVSTANSFVQSQNVQLREELSLSGTGWKVWLDSTAEWKNDSLYLPRTLDLTYVPSNPPTCGWTEMFSGKGKTANVPGSFEELFGNGNPLWRYHGVGWFFREIDVPDSWAGRTILLNIEKARLRLELYVNDKLAGYDIVAETPYSADITSYLRTGQKNRIAIRITNPGGQRGWNDSPATDWGRLKLCPGHDFGGIGNISLQITPDCYLENIFVKNLLPALGNNIEIQLAVRNKKANSQQLTFTVEILSWPSNEIIASDGWTAGSEGGIVNLFARRMTVPGAKQWDINSPNLYYCRVRISDGQSSDMHQVRFGFRVFEVKENETGEENFYLNGNRIRIRSAIDWGYYWQTGFYANDEMALKSVRNAKAIGHNCISFHRRIGEPLVMKYADELGLLIYEEPGGMQGVSELRTPSWIMNNPMHEAYYAAFTMPEKFSRMVQRDRNNPSVIIWSIVNEQCTFDYIHKKIFEETFAADNSRLIVNQSGGHYGDASGFIPHHRPYEFNPRLNYIDDHTVDSKAIFQESDLFSHESHNDSSIIYWGEVRCYAGPDNYYLLSKPASLTGYDYTSWKVLGEKTEHYFLLNDFSRHPSVKSPADISVQAGRGLMYIDGRLSQTIMANNTNEGYAINGWSGADQSLGDDFMAWYSAICDEGRNLKGPATDYNFWTRDLQITARRKNGKYFSPGDTAIFSIGLINEKKLERGEYKLRIELLDGMNFAVGSAHEQDILVEGGDTYAQVLIPGFRVHFKDQWNAGYITLVCSLLKGKQLVATGREQVLLQNRPSYANQLKDCSFAVANWEAAKVALQEAGATPTEYITNEKADIILAGREDTDQQLASMLQQVKRGASLIIRFDSAWAEILFRQKILKRKVTVWGGKQTSYWNGNGWGYLDLLVRPFAVPSGYTIGTNSWEVPGDPVGFEPFESNFRQKSHGAFFFRPDLLLTLTGEICYGKGRILLAPSYPVDANNALNDMLFFNMLLYR
jgi:hypothetical protein